MPTTAHRMSALIRVAAIALMPLVQCCGGGGGDSSVPVAAAPADTASAISRLDASPGSTQAQKPSN
jgi:hypothetical protein